MKTITPKQAALAIGTLISICILSAMVHEGCFSPRPGFIKQHSDITGDTICLEVIVACPIGQKYFPRQSSWDCVILEGCATDSQHAAALKYVTDSCTPNSGFMDERPNTEGRERILKAILKAKRRDSL